MHRIRSLIRTADPWHLLLALLVAGMLLFLVIRASDEYRWSDWGFGDAQTMLSLRQWEEGGWFRNYFLFKPQGYAKVIDLFDDPELRHHAHGTCPGSSPRVGPRLLYTHYPAGYLIPYALLFRVGLDGMLAVRSLSILFSLGALVLMYATFAKITSPRVSFLAVLFYALSSPFLGYADSLANQPIDDLLRFGFMFAVVLATRAGDERLQRRWMGAAWVIEFCLSLTSFDSVFFIYGWLIGWDLLEKRGFRWKTYLLFSLAPVTAHGLQFLQNIWYLGVQDAVIDIKDAFLLKHGADTGYNVGEGRISVIATSLGILFTNLFRQLPILAIMLVLYLLARPLVAKTDRELPSPMLLLVLFLCGAAFILILPHAARMPYEARQMIPFVAVLVSGFCWSVVRGFQLSLHGEGGGERAGTGMRKQIALISFLVVSSVLLLIFWIGFASADRTPVYTIPPGLSDIPFARDLRTFPTPYEPVYFENGGFTKYWDPTYVPGYPQILPLTEYYAGSRPILCFNDADQLAKDIITMVRKSPGRFSPVVIADRPETLAAVLDILQKEGILAGVPQNITVHMDRYVIDLSAFVKWSAHAPDTDTR